jgi:hypothetical protein
MDWMKARLAERTSLDGAVLIAIGGSVLLLGPLAKWAALGAIAYGAWTLVKGE